MSAEAEPRPAAHSPLRAVLRSTATAGLLIVAYALFPSGVLSFAPVVYFAAGAVLFGLSLAWQLRNIVQAERPVDRLIEAVGIMVPLAVIVFATIYFVISTDSPAAFGEPLSKLDAVYFSVTVLATVGFGDIAPISEQARLFVTIQMLIDLVLFAAVVRLLAGAVRRSGRG